MPQRELTERIRLWLDTPEDSRDILAGAELLLRINRNRVFYNNVRRNPAAKAARVEYELKKIYRDRLDSATREEVAALLVKVDGIAAARGLASEPARNRSEFQRGKRADHDELPAEIRQLWVDNADLTRKMREAHTRLRMINSSNSSCPDSDRYPWAKEVVRLDSLIRDNYNRYDHYVKGTPAALAAPAVDPRSESKKFTRLVNMQKGRFAKGRNPELGQRIFEWFGKIDNPSPELAAELRGLGLPV